LLSSSCLLLLMLLHDDNQLDLRMTKPCVYDDIVA
jgi:hypothetical protein